MKIKIQSIHFDADKKLLDLIEEKVGKLDHFYDGIVGSSVILKLEKSDTSENKVAEIRLEIKGNDLFAKRQCKTFEEAVDQSVGALRAQLKKYKEKMKKL